MVISVCMYVSVVLVYLLCGSSKWKWGLIMYVWGEIVSENDLGIDMILIFLLIYVMWFYFNMFNIGSYFVFFYIVKFFNVIFGFFV